MIGEKDDWTPAAKCQAVTGKTDFEVIVYPGDTHAFTTPFEKPLDYLGHHMVYDEKATQDAQQRADAFMAAHMKCRFTSSGAGVPRLEPSADISACLSKPLYF
jgi:dienelactone hydrolase